MKNKRGQITDKPYKIHKIDSKWGRNLTKKYRTP